MYLLLIWSTKIIQRLSRLVGNSGAALPGFIIEKLYPQFLVVALRKLPDGVIVISGTNGKTTTTKLVADTLHSLGDRVMTNRTGSNMTRGLVSLIVGKSSISGKLPFDIAVLEVDEAYAAKLAEVVPIRGALVLNVMRDQLDRFGEIDKTAQYLSILTGHAEEFVVLNADDSRVVDLKVNNHTQKIYFSAGEKPRQHLKTEDDWHGGAIDKKNNTLSLKTAFSLRESSGFQLIVQANDSELKATAQLEGVHNHLNIVAALALLGQVKSNKSTKELLESICRVRPAFGRGERVKTGQGYVTLLLVKNPSSFVQTLSSTDLKAFDSTTIVINDAYADSRDVSWLWDVDVSKFSDAKKLYTGGRRGYDMAVRLKYDGIETQKILLEPKDVIAEVGLQKGSHAIFCTYTAMLALRRQLIRKGHLEQIV